MKLSIIIPAYNSEKYIAKCISSCLSQDIAHNDYEIIIIDDGSTDNTKGVVSQLQLKHKNIRYIYQENARQGAARNNGLYEAQGDYIWFVDSDDWIAENCLNTIITKLKNKNLTALLVARATQYAEKTVKWEDFDDNKLCTGKDLLNDNKFYIPPTYAIWHKSYLIDNNIKFIEKIFHEDSEICPRMFYNAGKIGFINKICYFVYPDLNSTTRGVNPQRAYDLIKVVKELTLFCENITEKQIKQTVVNYISKTINSSLYNSFLMDKEHIFILNKLWYQNKDLLKLLKDSNIIKYKIEGVLFALYPAKVCKIYKFLQLFNSNPGHMNEQKKLLNMTSL